MILYDHMLTVADEVKFVWHRQWNAVKVLFLLTRYLGFAISLMTLYGVFLTCHLTACCASLSPISPNMLDLHSGHLDHRL